MYAVVIGGGKVGLNLTRELLAKGTEVTLIESRRDRYLRMDAELGFVVQYGDGTELWVLERAGIQRADLVVAVTGDDEDNILICQIARDKYQVERFISRVNNPRNRQYFELLDIRPAFSATDLILRLIEHEVPDYGLVHLLDLPEEQLEVIEIVVCEGCRAAGLEVQQLELPEGSIVISVLRDEGGFVPKGDTVINAGDEVLVGADAHRQRAAEPGGDEQTRLVTEQREQPVGAAQVRHRIANGGHPGGVVAVVRRGAGLQPEPQAAVDEVADHFGVGLRQEPVAVGLEP